MPHPNLKQNYHNNKRTFLSHWILLLLLFILNFFAVLAIEPRALRILGKCFTSELHSQPYNESHNKNTFMFRSFPVPQDESSDLIHLKEVTIPYNLKSVYYNNSYIY